MEIFEKINTATNTVEITMFGFTAEIKQGLSFNQTTQRYQTKYSVLFERQVIALSQSELEKYLMFIDYVHYRLQEMNA